MGNSQNQILAAGRRKAEMDPGGLVLDDQLIAVLAIDHGIGILAADLLEGDGIDVRGLNRDVTGCPFDLDLPDLMGGNLPAAEDISIGLCVCPEGVQPHTKADEQNSKKHDNDQTENDDTDDSVSFHVSCPPSDPKWH